MKQFSICVLFFIVTLLFSGAAQAFADKDIKDDGSGGDCLLIGNWDAATKTCTLTNDLNEEISISSDKITLDGAGKTLTGNGNDVGVFTTNNKVTIKNLVIKNYDVGIFAVQVKEATITGNTISSSADGGIALFLSEKSTISGNTVNENDVGISLKNSKQNNISNNKVSDNKMIGIHLVDSPSNLIHQNTVKNNHPLAGIYLVKSNDNQIFSNDVSNPAALSGIDLFHSKANFIYYNLINNDVVQGINLSKQSNENRVFCNNVSLHPREVVVDASVSNLIWWNNFFLPGDAAVVAAPAPANHFDLGAPIAGNYWEINAPNCVDANNDMICDAPFNFPGDTDNLPWKFPIPWMLSTCFVPGDGGNGKPSSAIALIESPPEEFALLATGEYVPVENLASSDTVIEIEEFVIEERQLSPRLQMELGVPPEQFYCKEGLIPLQHISGEKIVCVKTDTASKLSEVGWGPIIESINSITLDLKSFLE